MAEHRIRHAEPSPDPAGRPERRLAVDVAEHVHQIVASAERAAAEIHRAAEEAARRQSDDARAAAAADADRMRHDAEVMVQRWLSESRSRIDALTRDRIARIDELTGDLIAQCEAIRDRFEAATTIKAQVEEVLVALGSAAAQLAREADGDADVPRLGWHRGG